MFFESSLGIDIRDNCLVFVHLKKSFKKIIFAEHEIFPVETGKPADESGKIYPELIQNFISKNNIKPDTIFLGLPRNTVLLKYIELPLAVKENLENTLTYEIEKYFPLAADDIYFDFQIIETDNSNNKINLLVAAVKKNIVDTILETCRQAGIYFSGIEISSTALANSLSYDRPTGHDHPYLAVADIRSDHIELDILKMDMLIYSRYIKADTKDPDLTAKRLINELHAASLILPTKTDETGNRPDGLSLTLTGSGADEELYTLIREKGTVDTVAYTSLRAHTIPAGFETAYGLAVKGVAVTALDINLAPAGSLKKPGRAGRNIFFILFILSIISAAGWSGSSFIKSKIIINRLNAEIAALKPEFKQIEHLRTELNEIEKKLEQINRLSHNNRSILKIVNTLAMLIPKNAWVKNIICKNGTVDIEGYADTASEIIPALEQSPMFSDVSFKSTIVKDKNGKERFKIGMSLIGMSPAETE
ncbi:MAG: pilus assembly protein PilM [Desulfosarcina sp.]|nr:pilus assembly protein PilM [Desulfobacterales bacterium]